MWWGQAESDEVSRETSPASDESLQESNHFRLNSEGHTQLVPFDNMSVPFDNTSVPFDNTSVPFDNTSVPF